MKNLLCLLISLGCFLHTSIAQDIYYLPGSTEKIEQLVGDFDRHFGEATQNLTDTRYRIWGTDLGVPFHHNGKTFLLFGDIPGDIGFGADRDPIAFTTDNNPEDGLSLEFISDNNGTYHPISIAGVNQGAFEVPLDGISINGEMYIYHSTDNMTRSVLAKSSDEGRSFQLINDKVSDQYFINVSVNKVKRSQLSNLPGNMEDGLLVMGSGAYRSSSVYLYYQAENEIENDQSMYYFSGMQGGAPSWSQNESNCVPIIQDDCVGELSSAYNVHLDKWMVLYNCDDPRGIVLRLADHPWGPYSRPIVLFDPDRDDGYCHFIHANWQVRNCDEVHDPGRENEWGGEYGPYLFKDFTTRKDSMVTIYYTMSTWNPYTTVLMKSVLIIPDQTNSIPEENRTFSINPYPNPTSGLFSLPMRDNTNATIRILNIYGQRVYETRLNNEIDISTLSSGLYLGKISINNHTSYIFKILKTE